MLQIVNIAICDRCNKPVPHNSRYYRLKGLSMNEVSVDDYNSDLDFKLELCCDCYEKVKDNIFKQEAI